MLNTSLEFRAAIAQGARPQVKAQLVLANGKRINLTGKDFAEGSFYFSQATSSSGSFDIGAAIVGTFECTLNNFDRKFEEYDFTGARIIPSVGIPVASGTVEWLMKGIYYIEQPSTYDSTIKLSCVDAMSKFEKPYVVGTKYPASAQQIVLDICKKCGVSLRDSNFALCGQIAKIKPDSTNTCKDVLSYVAQATGHYCRITNDGFLELDWYDPHAFTAEVWRDGGEYDDAKPYASGDKADGGNFTDYSSGAKIDGGTFDSNRIINIWAYNSSTTTTDDVVITGVRVTAQDQVKSDGTKGNSGETALYGKEGYVLEIEDNPLIDYGRASLIAGRIGARVVGLRFRPFDASVVGDPSIEPGDPAYISDRFQNSQRTYLTSVTYKVGAYAAYKCDAEAPLRNSSKSSSAVTKVKQQLTNLLEKEQTAREVALQRFQDELDNATGVYTTSIKENGATTYYIHDKKDRRDSKFILKVNAAGFGISINGGKSYDYGLDKWGNAILNNIYAIGIDAQYITTGALRLYQNGDPRTKKIVFEANASRGTFYWTLGKSSMSTTGFLTITGGNIGSFTIDSAKLTNGKHSLKSQEQGVYIGKDGISTGSSNSWVAMTNGRILGSIQANDKTPSYIVFHYSPEGDVNKNSLILGTTYNIVFNCSDIYVSDYVHHETSPMSVKGNYSGRTWSGSATFLDGKNFKIEFPDFEIETPTPVHLKVAITDDGKTVSGFRQITTCDPRGFRLRKTKYGSLSARYSHWRFAKGMVLA